MERLDLDSLKLMLEARDEKTRSKRLGELAKASSTLGRLVAGNPNADPQLLAELASREDESIRREVAGNPNAPTEVLWELGEEFPEEVLENAVFSLLLLENPNLVETIPEDTLLNFLKCSAVPVSFMERATNSWYMRWQLAIIMNPKTTKTILEKLVKSENAMVAETAQLHVKYSGELNKSWEKAVCERMRNIYFDELNDYSLTVSCLVALANIGLVPEFMLEQLAQHQNDGVCYFVATYLNVPLHLLEQLAQHEKKDIRQGVAINPYTPACLLERLARDKTLRVRSTAATNPNTPINIIEEFARSNYVWAVARSLNTPVNVLEEFAESRYAVVASNPNTPVRCLEQFAVDDNNFARQQVASNPNTPAYLLELLARDREETVRSQVARHPYVPVCLLEQLALDTRFYVRNGVASNPSTPIAILERLAQDSDLGIRGSVASNINTPFDLLEQLLWFLPVRQIEEKALSRYLAKKPNELPRVLEHYAINLEKETEDSETFYLTRAVVLWHPQMPAKVLAKNCRSLAWLERCAIAGNPNTPTETLQILAEDGNRIVRAAARENLGDRYQT